MRNWNSLWFFPLNFCFVTAIDNHFRGRMLPLFSQFSGCQREGVHYTNKIAGTETFDTFFTFIQTLKIIHTLIFYSMQYEVTWKTVMQIAKKHAVSWFSLLWIPILPVREWINSFLLISNCHSVEISCSSFTEAISGTKNGTCFHELDMVGAGWSSVSTFSSCDGLLFPWGHQSFLSDFVGDIDFIPEARSKFVIGNSIGEWWRRSRQRRWRHYSSHIIVIVVDPNDNSKSQWQPKIE